MKNFFEDPIGENSMSDVSNHRLEDAAIEADPRLYSTRFMGRTKSEVKRELMKNSELSIVIDTERYTIGIGSDHYNMYLDLGIDSKSYFAARAIIDRTTGKIRVKDFTDCRVGQDLPAAGELKKAIAERLQMDIFS